MNCGRVWTVWCRPTISASGLDMALAVKREAGGTWAVFDGDKRVSGGMTNAEAWRHLDKVSGDPVNRQQESSDWSFNRGASGQ